MAVINFWLEADIDDRATLVEGGPRAKEGGMSIKIKQRENGRIFTAMSVKCYEENGYLFTEVYGVKGELLGTVQSLR